MKKLSKRQREEMANKKDSRITNWFCFIFGFVFTIGGLRRLFSGSIGIQINHRTNYPILGNGLYPLAIGLLLIGIGFYRILYQKKE